MLTFTKRLSSLFLLLFVTNATIPVAANQKHGNPFVLRPGGLNWVSAPDFDCRANPHLFHLDDFLDRHIDFANALMMLYEKRYHDDWFGKDEFIVIERFLKEIRLMTTDEALYGATTPDNEILANNPHVNKQPLLFIDDMISQLNLYDGKYTMKLIYRCFFSVVLKETMEQVVCLLLPEDDRRCTGNLKNAAGKYDDHFSLILAQHSMAVALNSKFFHILNVLVGLGRMLGKHRKKTYPEDIQAAIDKEINCFEVPKEEQKCDWKEFLAGFSTGKDFVEATTKYVWGSMFREFPKWYEQCPMGSITLMQIRLMIACKALSDQYAYMQGLFVQYVAETLENIHSRAPELIPYVRSTTLLLFMTEWPVFDLITLIGRHLSQRDANDAWTYQHKPYKLDFLRHEIYLYYDYDADNTYGLPNNHVIEFNKHASYVAPVLTAGILEGSMNRSHSEEESNSNGEITKSKILPDICVADNRPELVCKTNENTLVAEQALRYKGALSRENQLKEVENIGTLFSESRELMEMMGAHISETEKPGKGSGTPLAESSRKNFGPFHLRSNNILGMGEPEWFKLRRRIYNVDYNPLIIDDRVSNLFRDAGQAVFIENGPDGVKHEHEDGSEKILYPDQITSIQSPAGGDNNSGFMLNWASKQYFMEPPSGLYGSDFSSSIGEDQRQPELDHLGTVHHFNLSLTEHRKMLEELRDEITLSPGHHSMHYFTILGAVIEIFEILEAQSEMTEMEDRQKGGGKKGKGKSSKSSSRGSNNMKNGAGGKSISPRRLTDIEIAHLASKTRGARGDVASLGIPVEFENNPLKELLTVTEEEAEIVNNHGNSGETIYSAAENSATEDAVKEVMKKDPSYIPVRKRSGKSGKIIPRVHACVVWGTRVTQYLRNFLLRAKAFGLHYRFFVFCLDDISHKDCLKNHPAPTESLRKGLCIPGGTKTIYNKYTIAAVLGNLGVDVVYQDLDTVFLQDPNHLFDELHWDRSVDIATARDFGVKCTNTGVILFKATPASQLFVQNWMIFSWWHPYEFSQKTFSSFFEIENVTVPIESPPGVGFYPDTGVRKPHLALFNSEQEVVTQLVYGDAEGWYGDLDKIKIFHFVDGTGGVDVERAVNKRYVNAYAVFYNNTKLDLEDPDTPLYDQDPGIGEFLLRSRQKKAPEELKECVLYISNAAP